MNELDNITNLIDKKAETYIPTEEVRAKLAEVTLVPLIGPVAVGKTTTMNFIEANYPSFGQCHGFTTRDLRPGEEPDTYRFLPHNHQTLENILYNMRRGELVQVAVHPTTRKIYGSNLEDYNKPFIMLDALATSIEDIERVGFGAVKPIVLITSTHDWQERLNQRMFNGGKKELADRLAEAMISLEWSLAQGSDIPWVVNADNHINNAAEEVVALTLENKSPDITNRHLGEELLKYVQSKQVELT